VACKLVAEERLGPRLAPRADVRATLGAEDPASSCMLGISGKGGTTRGRAVEAMCGSGHASACRAQDDGVHVEDETELDDGEDRSAAQSWGVRGGAGAGGLQTSL
jgi:hypothetical protein